MELSVASRIASTDLLPGPQSQFPADVLDVGFDGVPGDVEAVRDLWVVNPSAPRFATSRSRGLRIRSSSNPTSEIASARSWSKVMLEPSA
jgi:hypothetical protein